MKWLAPAHGTWEAACLGLHHLQRTSHGTRGTRTLAAPCGDVGPLSSLHVSDRRWRGWWWPRLAVNTGGDGMLMLQAAGASVVLYASK